MTIDALQGILGWGIVINIAFLLWWFLFIVFAHDWVYKMHTKWFKISVETFDAIHYAGIAFYKILMFVLFIIPYIVIRIMF